MEPVSVAGLVGRLINKEIEMPYDPRPVSEGGNRGIGELFTHVAPKGKYRIVGVDTFDASDWVEGDFLTLVLAIMHADARTRGQHMLMMHIYDDTGRHRYETGTF
jgi:hypothetical protein